MSASSSSTLGKFELWKCQERRESGRLRLRPWPSLPSCCDDHDYWDAGERQDRDLDYRAPRAAAGFGEALLFGRNGHSWSLGEEVLLICSSSERAARPRGPFRRRGTAAGGREVSLASSFVASYSPLRMRPTMPR